MIKMKLSSVVSAQIVPVRIGPVTVIEPIIGGALAIAVAIAVAVEPIIITIAAIKSLP
jgi:hypothetical protein